MNFFKSKQLRAAVGLLFSISIFLLPLITVVAATGGPNSASLPGGPNSAGVTTPNSGGVYGGSNTLKNPLGVNSFCDLIVVILNAALIIGIPIAVLFIVYAGFKFVMARGSPTGLSEARSNLFNTLIGIAIFIGASLIARVIVGTLEQLGVNVGSCI
jgi:hypothetical protein